MPAAHELLLQSLRLGNEDRRCLAEMIWETVDTDLPAACQDEEGIAKRVEQLYEEYRSGRKPGLAHEEVFTAARAVL